MIHRIADGNDLALLASWNHELIQDEGHRNSMSVHQLRDRMETWLSAEYTAVLFDKDTMPIAYALYREDADQLYLRQYFVRGGRRREGVGREAINILRESIWQPHKRLTVDVLTSNESGVAFWCAVGYTDYCLTLEIMPNVQETT